VLLAAAALAAGCGEKKPSSLQVEVNSVGRRHDVAYFRAYVANPEQFGNQVMPRFASYGRRRLTNLAIFLKASQGPR
jgi:hypothetical protein